MNVIKDVIFEGRILDMVRVHGICKEPDPRTPFLGKDGLFVTIPELPEFCWTELIVNAICSSRSYNITGTDIQVKCSVTTWL